MTLSKRQPQPLERSVFWCLVGLTAAVFSLSTFVYVAPADGLDPGWVGIFQRMSETQPAWREDVTFTFGPMSWLLYPTPGQILPAFLFLLFTTLPAAFIVGKTIRSLGLFALIVAGLLVATRGDFPLLILHGVSLFLLGLARSGRLKAYVPDGIRELPIRMNLTCTAISIAGLSGLALGKYNYGLSALVLVVAIDVWMNLGEFVSRFKGADGSKTLKLAFPINTLCLIAFITVGFLFYGFNVSEIGEQLSGALEISSGYTTAMAVFIYPTMDFLPLLLVSGFITGLIVIFTNYRDIVGLFMMMGLTGLVWGITLFSYKSGYIRADGHISIAWQGLSFALIMFGVLTPLLLRRARPALSVFAILSGVGVALSVPDGVSVFSDAKDEVRAASYLLPGQRQKLNSQREALLEQRRAALAAAGLDKDTIDVYPWELTLVSHPDVNYKPRPVLQSYSGYTADLQAANAQHVKDNGPDNILMFPMNSIDNRIQGAVLGEELPALLAHYDYRCETFVHPTIAMEAAILRRRETPRTVTTPDVSKRQIQWSEWIDIPDTDSDTFIFMNIDPEHGIVQKLMNLVLVTRPPIVELRYPDGQVLQRRWLDTDGGLGSIVSHDAIRIQSLYSAQDTVKKPDAIRWIKQEYRGAYTDDLPLTITRKTLSPSLRPKGCGGFSFISVSGPDNYPQGQDGMFAHAPSVVELKVPDDRATPIIITAGIRDGAFGDHDGDVVVDGVEFRVIDGDAGVVLWSTTITPDDTGLEKSERIDLSTVQGSRLTLRTDIIGNGNADWSYWRVESRLSPQ